MQRWQGFSLIVTVLLLITSGLYGAGFDEKSQYSLELWNRLSYVDDGSDKDPALGFSLDRAYLRMEHNFNKNIKARFNVDIFSSTKDGDVHGAGLKLKYGYLEFKNIIPVLPHSKIQAGLIKNYFGTIYSWEYETIEKDASDKWKFAPSCDYGIALSGAFDLLTPKGLSYNLALYNGEGYKKSFGEVNNEFAYLLNIRVKPWENIHTNTKIELGGSYKIDSKEWSNALANNGTDYIANNEHQKINSYTLNSHINFSDLSLLAQYVASKIEYDNLNDDKEIKSQVISIFANYNLKKITSLNLDILARYDNYDKNRDLSDDKENILIVGTNYHFIKNCQLQLNYEKHSYEDNSKSTENQLMLQLRYKFKDVFTR